MEEDSNILHEPGLRNLVAHRSRLRWGLSGGLIGIYFAYCLGGVYFNEAFARPVFGTSISLSIALGYLIILLAIVLSIVYIRIVGHLLDLSRRDRESRK